MSVDHDAQNFANGGKAYALGFAVKPRLCHVFDGDSMEIYSTAGAWKVRYMDSVSRYVAPNDGTKNVRFWDSVTLQHNDDLGILYGEGVDQFGGKDEIRPVCVSLDRSRHDPFVAHIYVGARRGIPSPPDDGSATGTGGK
jgi:hypothetical protein